MSPRVCVLGTVPARRPAGAADAGACGGRRSRLPADSERPGRGWGPGGGFWRRVSPPLAALKSHLCIVPGSGSALAAVTSAARLLCRRGLRLPSRQSPRTRAFFVIRCIGSPACPTMSDAAVDTSSEITTKDLKEKKEVVEEAENGRDAPANGNANEENGEQEADNEVDEEEEEGGEEEEEEEEGDGEEEDGDEDEEAEAATGKRAAEDDEDDDVDTKKQKTDEDD
ncbi:prothymosin alpha isoform X2 [Elephas maximus indicus]|uniref:prothymosin alpha isoform X2 n=1 Tax=Elephas maximus indicus TaxID=99487 RepID=UPI002116CDF2|nr:prothymosin alpha isoform X2 [Elephas maximus indicus]